MLAYQCEIDLAFTYALRRPRLAIECAWRALKAAVQIKRPDLAYRANELISAMGGAL